MALARIITRSHACSRELALDLLERGYAVEIVSPDSIPDNIADLELRVEAGPGDQLIASVEAHDGARPASLEFVHHLKSPMVDFIRRPPEAAEALHFLEEPVSFNAEPTIEDVEMPAENWEPLPEVVSRAAEHRRDPKLDPGVDFEESARLIVPLDAPPLPDKSPIHFSAQASTTVRPVRAPLWRARPAGWFGRAALCFAGVVLLLALVLGFGMRRSGKASADNSGAGPVEKVAAASADPHRLSAADSGKDPGQDPAKDLGKDPAKDSRRASVLAPPPPPAPTSQGNSTLAPDQLPAASAGASPASSGAKISRKHGDDLIARDTVTYLDQSFDKRAKNAKPAKHLAGRHSSSHKRRATGVAADTVTYLDQKPAPKMAKPN